MIDLFDITCILYSEIHKPITKRNPVSKRIWDDRCEDCYNPRKLKKCNDDSLPTGMSAELCEDCIRRIKLLRRQGLEPPHIGLLMEGVCQDTPPLVVVQGGQRINVSVKFLICDYEDNSGVVRLRFNDEPKWLAAGVYGISTPWALSEAKFFLREFYFNGAPISFE